MTLSGFKSITVKERTYAKIEEFARMSNRSMSNLIDTLVMTDLIKEDQCNSMIFRRPNGDSK